MYSQGEIRRWAEKKARMAAALAITKASADAREEQARKTASVRAVNNTTLPAPKTAAGRNLDDNINIAKKSKMAVYNDPVVSSSSKRKANDHADAPSPKKANNNTFVPRVPEERYQGTAARLPAASRSVLKSRPVTQAKVRNDKATDVDALSSFVKAKALQQQKAKASNAMELDVSSSLGRKRGAEDELNENTAKKQRLDSAPSPNPSLPQGSKAGKAAVAVKPAPKSNFFQSLYPKGSKLKASAGRAVVTTEIVKTATPPTSSQAPSLQHIAHIKATSVVEDQKSPTPPQATKKDCENPVTKTNSVVRKTPNEQKERLPTPAAASEGENNSEETATSGQSLVKKTQQARSNRESASAKCTESQSHDVSTGETKKSLKRKNDGACEEDPQNKKHKRGGESAVQGKENALGNAGASVKETPKPVSPSKDEGRKGETQESQTHAGKAERSFDDPKIEIERPGVGKELPHAGAYDHTPSANRNGLSSTVGNKVPSEEGNDTEPQLDARGMKPRGIRNWANACYINSVLQAVANIPRMADRYRRLADTTVPEVAEFVASNAKDLEGGDAVTKNKNISKSTSMARQNLNALLEKSKSKICLGAHLGVLLNAMLDAGSSPEAPSSYVFGQACGVLLKSDEGQGYDGAAQRECMEFFEKLLDHLDAEELNERTENLDAPSLVRELFGLEAVTKIKCQSCGHARDSCVERKFAFTTDMPRRQDRKPSSSSVSITECLDTYSHPDHVEVHCDRCGKTSEASKWMQLRNLSPYVLVNFNRVMVQGGGDGIRFTKNPDHISLPPSEVVTMNDGAQDVRYAVIGELKHKGIHLNSGHWVSSMKIDGQWWHFDDASADITGLKGAVTTNVLLKRMA